LSAVAFSTNANVPGAKVPVDLLGLLSGKAVLLGAIDVLLTK